MVEVFGVGVVTLFVGLIVWLVRFLASESAKTRDTRGCMRQTVNRKELEVRIWGKIYSDCAEERESLRRRSAVPFRRVCKDFQSKVRWGSEKAFRFITK
jgi:hypothetical protein